MYRSLTAVAIVAALVMGFIGLYGVLDAGSATTPELHEDQFFSALAILAGAIGLLAVGISRLIPGAGTRA